MVEGRIWDTIVGERNGNGRKHLTGMANTVDRYTCKSACDSRFDGAGGRGDKRSCSSL